MQIVHKYLTLNDYSRPGRKLREVLGVVIHWTADADSDALQVRDYFEAKKTGFGSYGSAHYIIGQNGIICAAIPENEVAYHCGSDKPDPVSGKVYTDEARRRFGHYASVKNSPNNCTIGLELCPADYDGNFTIATLYAAAELCADILKRYGLKPLHITTHKIIVGWKDCPKLWANDPQQLINFRRQVADKMRL